MCTAPFSLKQDSVQLTVELKQLFVKLGKVLDCPDHLAGVGILIVIP